ncbi:unnamed protein product [Ilex paraguariensis]|uniref:Uncharacterized protein n=1 Tax=Ilex paraguariensis TaxID=185542 RepID=A0ABC8SGV2_9AQUA
MYEHRLLLHELRHLQSLALPQIFKGDTTLMTTRIMDVALPTSYKTSTFELLQKLDSAFFAIEGTLGVGTGRET